MTNERKVEHIVQQVFADDANFNDCFLLEIKEIKPKKFQVFFDSDSGVNFLKCQKLSRAVETYLDIDPEFPNNYILEISSGGVERPLQLLRQYPKHIGRKLTIWHGDHLTEGKLVAVKEGSVTIEVKNNRHLNQIQISFEQIKKSIVNISFK